MRSDLNLGRVAEIPDPFVATDASALPPAPRPVGGSPTRARAHARQWLALAVAVSIQVAAVAFLGPRPDLPGIPRWAVGAALLAPLAAAAMCLAAVLRPGTHGLGENAAKLGSAAALAVALFASVTLLSAPFGAEGHAFWHRAAVCFATTCVLAVGPWALSAWAFRHAFVAAPVWRTAVLGVCCGAVAVATMSLICSDGNASHVLVGHGGGMLIGALAGAWLGRGFTAA
jgi:hypothetical protein